LSKSEPPDEPASTDPVITARIEAIKQLAQGLSDRVAVMDRSFNVVYANEAAWAETTTRRPQAEESFPAKPIPVSRQAK